MMDGRPLVPSPTTSSCRRRLEPFVLPENVHMSPMFRSVSLKVAIIKEKWSDVRHILATTRGKESVANKRYTFHDSSESRQAKLTALHLACHYGAPLDIIKLVLEICPDLVKIKSDHAGDLPLHYAVDRLAKHPTVAAGETVAHLLMTYPEAVAIKSSSDGSFGDSVHPLHVAVVASLDPIWVEMLVEICPSAKNIRNAEGRTAHDCASREHVYRDREDERRQVLELLAPDPTPVQRVTRLFCFLAFYSLLCTSVSILWALFVVVNKSHVYYLLIFFESASVVYLVDMYRTRAPKLAWRLQQKIQPALDVLWRIKDAIAEKEVEESKTGLTAESLGLCIVCWDKPISHIIMPCGHLCLCADCASPRRRRDLPCCPVDKCTIECTTKVYIAAVPR